MNNRSSKLKVQSSKEAPKNKLKAPKSVGEVKALYDVVAMSVAVLYDAPEASVNGHSWDLCERTAVFGEKVVRFSKTIPRSPTNDRLIDQLVGASTSVGANYHEANEAVSKKDLEEHHQPVHEGSERGEVLLSHGRGFRAAARGGGASALSRGSRASAHLRLHAT